MIASPREGGPLRRWTPRSRTGRILVVAPLAVGLLSLAGCVADPAPLIGTASAGDGEVTLSWERPTGDNGVTLTAYEVTPHIGDVAQAPTRFASTATTQTIDGLTNGVTYTFTVHGINALGSATARSARSNAVTPRDELPLATGGGHTCAVRGDGSVRCWGTNKQGQLGTGDTTSSATPVTVTGIDTAIDVVAGVLHTCALLAGGTVQCWGNNGYGQLGNGTTVDSTVPVTVAGLSTATQLASGGYHVCAVLSDGTARCWGHADHGQLGNGMRTDAPTPRIVIGISNVAGIAGGTFHTCAALADGTARCWGLNTSRQLGNGTSVHSSSTPVAVTGLSTATQLAAGDVHSCALLADRALRCWGGGGSGQLGNGTSSTAPTPTAVSGISTATDLTAGGAHTCAVLADGRARCWGSSGSGQVGDGTVGFDVRTPVAVVGITTAGHVAAGSDFTCSALADQTARCWGENFNGNLGDGTTTDSATPVVVTGL